MVAFQFVLSPWFWLLLAVVFSVIELASAFSLTTVWFAVSAVVTAFGSGLTETLAEPVRFRLHLGIFLFISIILLVFTRPFVVKKLKIGKEKTNVDSLIGKPALVLKEIAEFEAGEVKINGQIWTAKSETGATFESGQRCEIVRIEGAHVVVAPYDKE
jgi:membrane protein implicated in regulation of membrane protease activity